MELKKSYAPLQMLVRPTGTISPSKIAAMLKERRSLYDRPDSMDGLKEVPYPEFSLFLRGGIVCSPARLSERGSA